MLRPLIMAVGVLAASAALAKPPAYEPPPETAQLAPGPDVEIAEANCSACHSVDYITTQPRGHADPKAFWSAAVVKMKNVYRYKGADEDMAKIVDYLAATYP
jgi:mono/diheme cytochrome c family protein